MTDIFRIKMNEGLEALGLALSENQMEQFYQYYELLVEWNKVMNLTAITELEEVITKHFIDSLLLIQVLPDLDLQDYRCIDVGTGAGFPGIPLKIAFPNLKITLLDSLNKRIGFLNEVIQKLNLESIETIHGRAEDYGNNREYREQYDLCVSRAVANMSTLSEYCLPFVKTGGFFVPYKSGKVEEEVTLARSAVKKLGGEMGEVITKILPGTDVERTFIPVKKTAVTAKKYPRKAGLPSKEPLK